MGAEIRRFAAIGDIHCEDRALAAVLGFVRPRGIDRVLAVGDIVDGPGDADRCCALLAEHGVITVRGNHERWFLSGEMRDTPGWTTEVAPSTRSFLESLPTTVELETVVGPMMLCHGIGEDDMAELTPDARGYALQAAISDLRHRDDLSLIVGGHTHQPMVRALGPFTFLNPGTLHRDAEPGFMLAHLEERRVEHFDVQADGTISLRATLDLPIA